MKTNPNDPAFSVAPFDSNVTRTLTKREYLAAQAMQGLLNKIDMAEQGWRKDLVKEAKKIADSLIDELNKD